MNEKEIIAKAQAGDRTALAKLVKMYEQTVYNFAYKICRDKEKAEHVMQETFLSMVKSIRQFSGKSKLSTWLYTIVSNHCLMMARSNKKHMHTSLDDDDALIDEKNITDWDVAPHKITENSELGHILDEAIKKLPPDYRIVFVMRDIQGLSTEETAKAMSLTIPNIKSRLHRARAFLRNELNKVFGNES
jgi:RNA polymerase sigma-70 factor (ECF subfamily)